MMTTANKIYTGLMAAALLDVASDRLIARSVQAGRLMVKVGKKVYKVTKKVRV